MASLTSKIIRGHKYYYARESKRVNGKPKIVRTVYLGTVDTIIKNACESKSGPETKEVQIMEFGGSAALLQIASRLRLVEIINCHAPKRNHGPSVGEYMLAAVINRAVKPSSKTALAAWFENTSLPRLTGICPKQLTSQAINPALNPCHAAIRGGQSAHTASNGIRATHPAHDHSSGGNAANSRKPAATAAIFLRIAPIRQ